MAQGGGTIKDLKDRVRSMPLSVAHSVAGRAAPLMTGFTRRAYASGQSVFGEARPSGVNGPLSLVDTGTTQRNVRFTSTGTLVRCFLGTKYAKYLIGKYGILPTRALPAEWKRGLDRLVAETRA